VRTGRRDEECPDSLVLAANIAQVEAVSRCAGLRPALLGQPIPGPTAQDACGACETLDDAQGKPLHEYRLVYVLRAQDEHCQPCLLGRLGDRKCPVTGPHLAVE
jgi:hypothetical protein